MSVKLGRYIFRRIGGRIVPIRVGAEAATVAKGLKGISASILRKVDKLRNIKRANKIAEFTKDSVIKSPVFHGTNSAKFSTFSHDKIGSNVGHTIGRGFYFTPDRKLASAYGKNVGEYFLNIKKPSIVDLNSGVKTKKLSKSLIEKLLSGKGVDLSNYGDVSFEGSKAVKSRAVNSIAKYNNDQLDQINDIAQSAYNNDLKKYFKRLREVTGYDGVVADNLKSRQVVAYNSDQILKSPKVSQLYKKFRARRK